MFFTIFFWFPFTLFTIISLFWCVFLVFASFLISFNIYLHVWIEFIQYELRILPFLSHLICNLCNFWIWINVAGVFFSCFGFCFIVSADLMDLFMYSVPYSLYVQIQKSMIGQLLWSIVPFKWKMNLIKCFFLSREKFLFDVEFWETGKTLFFALIQCFVLIRIAYNEMNGLRLCMYGKNSKLFWKSLKSNNSFKTIIE